MTEAQGPHLHFCAARENKANADIGAIMAFLKLLKSESKNKGGKS